MTHHNESASARIPGERFLHAPGPTHIPAEVLNAMHRQPMDHADPRLDAVIANCESELRRLLGYRAGYPIDASAVEEALRADARREIAAVFVVHTDTASGITHDIAAIRAAIDSTGHGRGGCCRQFTTARKGSRGVRAPVARPGCARR